MRKRFTASDLPKLNYRHGHTPELSEILGTMAKRKHWSLLLSWSSRRSSICSFPEPQDLILQPDPGGAPGHLVSRHGELPLAHGRWLPWCSVNKPRSALECSQVLCSKSG